MVGKTSNLLIIGKQICMKELITFLQFLQPVMRAQFSFSPFPKKRKRLSLCSFDQSLSCHFHVHCEVCCADSGLTSVNTRNGCSRPRNCGVILSYIYIYIYNSKSQKQLLIFSTGLNPEYKQNSIQMPLHAFHCI